MINSNFYIKDNQGKTFQKEIENALGIKLDVNYVSKAKAQSTLNFDNSLDFKISLEFILKKSDQYYSLITIAKVFNESKDLKMSKVFEDYLSERFKKDKTLLKIYLTTKNINNNLQELSFLTNALDEYLNQIKTQIYQDTVKLKQIKSILNSVHNAQIALNIAKSTIHSLNLKNNDLINELKENAINTYYKAFKRIFNAYKTLNWVNGSAPTKDKMINDLGLVRYSPDDFVNRTNLFTAVKF